MAPQPAPLTPHASARHFLGAELRRWRELRQLSSAELAGKVFVSRDLIRRVERAQRRASVELITACDDALDTGGALRRLLDYVIHLDQIHLDQIHLDQAPELEPLLVPPAPPPVSILVKITAEVVPGMSEDPPGSATRAGEARIYAFPGGRGRSRDGP